ncbi:hypothetical protein RIVM261_008830 [Rivularia sp. IAM M-261]|nr:hypothetical protein CAL7716_067410 [Calothrix sp. PCC 7716]GJD15927.1 hypothetical protein RIVM261_008830 [Rivularia sp. IAM M-261]
MTFFNYSVPPLRRKQATLDIHDIKGLWLVNWQIGSFRLYSNFYTRIDQAFLVWSLLLIPMFITAQFLPVDWSLQATLWSILSFVGTIVMMSWSHYWVKRRQVEWLLYLWAALMLIGIILTDLGISFGWGEILLNLCPLWLGLSATGYLCTGLAVRSRTLLITGAVHLLGIYILRFIGEWQFLATGALMAFCLLLLAEFEWDHL